MLECDTFFNIEKGKWDKVLFNDKQVEYIINKYLNNKDESTVTIANKFGVTYPTIKKVLKENNIKIKELKTYRQIYKIDEDFFEKIDTEEKAYWLGFLYADGVIIEKDNLVRINLQSEDYDHLCKFRNSISSTHPIKETSKKTVYKVYKGVFIAIHNSKMCKDLVSKGCTQRKSFTIKFPTEEIVPKDLIFHFIRGYFDGDGSISSSIKVGKVRDRTMYKLNIIGTEDIITNIRLTLGVESKVAKEKGNNYYTLYIGGNQQVERISDLLYKESKVYLDRKYKKYLQMKKYVKDADTSAWNKGLKLSQNKII